MSGHLDDEQLLVLWEHAVGLSGALRDDVLLVALGQPSSPLPLALGERNARLLESHAQCFGSGLTLLCHCPRCNAASQFDIDSAALASQLPVVDGLASAHRLELDRHRVEFRVPDSRDVSAASDGSDDFAQDLLQRCVLDCKRDGVDVPVQTLPAPVLDALSRQMQELDPGADVSFDLECPECGEHWESQLDVGQMLWTKLQAAAERVLLEIDALARAYGWSEGEVLRLSPTRRAAYLQLAGA